MADITEIVPGLYVGSEPKTWPDDINAIVCLTHLWPIYDEFTLIPPTNFRSFVWYPITDMPTPKFNEVWLALITGVIHQYLEHGMNVLVHCHLGVSRSPAVVVAYMIRYHGLSYDQAMEHVAIRRPCIDPIEHFKEVLKKFVEYVKANAM